MANRIVIHGPHGQELGLAIKYLEYHNRTARGPLIAYHSVLLVDALSEYIDID